MMTAPVISVGFPNSTVFAFKILAILAFVSMGTIGIIAPRLYSCVLGI